MRFALGAVADAVRVGSSFSQQLGREGPRGGSFAGSRRPVEEVGVRGLAARLERRTEHGQRVRVAFDRGERAHWLIVRVRSAR